MVQLFSTKKIAPPRVKSSGLAKLNTIWCTDEADLLALPTQIFLVVDFASELKGRFFVSGD